ncbi:hypothetical protein PISMIDRAFT_413872 [Pisolithus microcarpus 441]|uniref:Uncharacterized protein n=1 Tax=Pisolithus microcarpus 441 TaxID=765257 RepID=A0A0C9XLB9_9AGAM|nr:hypothetical protein PISMIDRAFT_413872 [Pisolithus microcarpus 441]
MFTEAFLSTVAAAALFAASASAICPGYKFGVSLASNNGPCKCCSFGLNARSPLDHRSRAGFR